MPRTFLAGLETRFKAKEKTKKTFIAILFGSWVCELWFIFHSFDHLLMKKMRKVDNSTRKEWQLPYVMDPHKKLTNSLLQHTLVTRC